MTKSLSPLRYPGGKSKIYNKVKNLILANGYEDRTYVEPFAGGFGIGIALLVEDIVQNAIFNDIDTHIYNFWNAIINDTDNILRLITDTEVTLDERARQKSVYLDDNADPLHDGFATLFLNRVNFSGVIKGGPIGGLKQTGRYRIDCRFKKDDICRKIETIADLKERISLHNNDAGVFISNNLMAAETPMFLNIDPPYVNKGHHLYKNYFVEADHRNLETTISKYLSETIWIVTYDDCALIRGVYKNYHIEDYGILHIVNGVKQGREIVITNIPQPIFIW